MDWMSREYPDTFDRDYRPRWERVAKMAEDGNRFFYRGLPTLCQVCQIPAVYSEPGDVTTSSIRHSEFDGELSRSQPSWPGGGEGPAATGDRPPADGLARQDAIGAGR